MIDYEKERIALVLRLADPIRIMAFSGFDELFHGPYHIVELQDFTGFQVLIMN